MSDNNSNTELLIQYLDGELEGGALEEARIKISSDPALQKELESLKDTQLAIKSYGLKQHVSNIHAQMMQELATAKKAKTPVRSFSGAFLRVAASVIFIVVMAGVYQYTNLSSTKLFDSNYQAYDIREARGENRSSTLEQLYKQNLMQQVINTFLKIEHPSVSDYFYAGSAYLKEHDANMAVKSFELLQQKNATLHTHLLEDDSEYYLAMSYLQNNESGKALPLFEKIHNDPQHLYHDKVSSWFLYKVKLLKNK